MLEQVTSLIALAEQVLACGKEQEADKFFALMNTYVAEFDVWVQSLEGQGPPSEDSALSPGEKKTLHATLVSLNELHHQVIAFAEERKADVAEEMRNLHKRGKALKTYVDRFPKRITIAGKREG